MGHPPFGHAGEEALDEALRDRFGRHGFRHNEQSLRIAERLNLTHEVRDGIFTHTGVQEPETLEGKIVRIVDRVAYINHDIDDALRHGILREADLPRDELQILGPTGCRRIDTLVHDLVETSEEAGDIAQSDRVAGALTSLRSFMFDRVYLGPETQARARARCGDGQEDLRPPRRPRGRASRDHRVRRGDDRPVRTLVRCRAGAVSRIKDSSVEEVKQRADMVVVVEARTQLRKAGAARSWAGARSTRSGRRASG